MRKVARMRPVGMDSFVEVFQLWPTGADYDAITDAELAQYEHAVEAVIAGDWKRARELLTGILADDGPANFLRQFLATNDDTPPADWDGAINLKNK